MSLPRLNVRRHDKHCRAPITLAGETDLETAPLADASLRACLHDGVRTLDVDLTAVTSCDVSGLHAFPHAAAQARRAGGTPASRIGDPPAPPRSMPLSSAGAR
ncbi:STAS domain-containing protein [Streptomyces flavofungini]|uniref:STAS domain-containing protein n=1 Tax=Streptomyces flavofungini TaxID=68200 RepID=UPI0025B212DB|nr:STAS domain-containing protein [Streptomyces flavofungini]WJV47212.1 STAS domain-containing protein [Streptomyces flavofungini]